jgi:multimeric flavodoxin WrbA
VQDDLAPILDEIGNADAILIGSPIYLSVTTGETRSFLERLVFPYLVYDRARSTLFPKKIRTAFMYTANAGYEMLNAMGVPQGVQTTERLMERIFGSCESFFVTDTLQFDNYADYVSGAYDPVAKKKRHDTRFPLDCRKAYELGARLVQSTAP